MLFQMIVLTGQQKIGKERSISGLYYIMQGKPSIQTLQDANLFGLENYYGIYKSMKKQRFMNLVEGLTKDGYLRKENVNIYVLTEKGLKWMKNNHSILNYMYLNGHKFQQVDQLFSARIMLLIQVWTNAKRKEYNFIPMIENKEVENWVKNYFQLTQKKLTVYLHNLYKELFTLFTPLPNIYPEIFLGQLTTNHVIGKTMSQLAMEYSLPKEEVYLITVNVLHYILDTSQTEKENYPVLHTVGKQIRVSKNLTESAAKTAYFLKQGLTISEIAERRYLKVNTIYDHLVEIAITSPVFPLDNYVKPSVQKEIIKATEQVASFKLKDIKGAVDADISYFQIRLVLAKKNDVQYAGKETGVKHE